MLATLELIINVVISLLYTWFIYRIVEMVLNLRPQKWIRFLFFMGIFGASDPVLFPEELTGSLALLLVFFVSLVLADSSSFLKKLSFMLIFYPVWAALSYLTENLGFVIWLYGFHKTLSPAAELALHSVCMALRIPFWAVVWCFVKRRLETTSFEFSRKLWCIIDLICLASFLGIIFMIYFADTDLSYLTWPPCIACILTNMGVLFVCSCFSRNLRTELELDMLRIQKGYYEEMAVEQEKVRKLRHDMRNHLNVLQVFLKDGETCQARDYLSRLSDEFQTDLRSFCENPIINAVLNAKYHLARSCNITCRFHLQLPQDVGIDSVSLCLLVANTLDNAIEACCKIPEDSSLSRDILLKARCTSGFFSYYIENTKINPVHEKHGVFLTDKEEAALHGFGLKSATDMVRRRGGSIDISYTDEIFSVTALIPLGQVVATGLRDMETVGEKHL